LIDAKCFLSTGWAKRVKCFDVDPNAECLAAGQVPRGRQGPINGVASLVVEVDATIEP
jgi:hypothetical protein